MDTGSQHKLNNKHFWNLSLFTGSNWGEKEKNSKMEDVLWRGKCFQSENCIVLSTILRYPGTKK